jgi:hypothetical protein
LWHKVWDAQHEISEPESCQEHDDDEKEEEEEEDPQEMTNHQFHI